MVVDFRDNMQKCQEYIQALEEEGRKIQVFQRELPLCFELVTQGTYFLNLDGFCIYASRIIKAAYILIFLNLDRVCIEINGFFGMNLQRLKHVSSNCLGQQLRSVLMGILSVQSKPLATDQFWRNLSP